MIFLLIELGICFVWGGAVLICPGPVAAIAGFVTLCGAVFLTERKRRA